MAISHAFLCVIVDIEALKLYNENNQSIPTLDEILKLRQPPTWNPTDDRQLTNNKAFVFMVDFIYGSLIGKRQWKRNKLIMPVSKQLTISDEAFVLLVLENNWAILNNDDFAEPKYTSRKKTSNKRNDGWSNDGIIRYNELQEAIKINRKTLFAFNVEEGVMNFLYEMEKGVDARIKRDNGQYDVLDIYKSRAKKRMKLQEQRAEPMFCLDDSDVENFESV